ncbi:MarR family winged helix-turn-helix transcriptional regulator [Paenibacillus sp. B01]|uniref:MarR family winged helix-turn-helix transcriptional regulator n=1 Tax=Paenibacillus sp. B01 TaxID=2660554 RepID=UPI00129B6A56|nr:MarR family transcriptional regulator [Paenibacillus sp. B01]QGG54571.1 MarR family transcriptional regulator [Paenibacillus sp. B01]
MSCRTEDLLYVLIHLNKQLACRFETDVGVSPNRLELLCQLRGAEEISQSELQKAVSIDPAAVTRHMQQLEAEGKLVRTRCQDDNRVTKVRLTDEGRSWIESCNRQKERFMERLQAGLEESERKELLRLLAALGRSLEEPPLPAALPAALRLRRSGARRARG